ncbi:hypothetical protein ACE4RU_11720 [Actinobacillus seminis]|uniref:hypothetical protein n=1 Tax=Actinobacillus seminis TaxID=722 RepID=UPI003B94BC5A
MEGIFKPDANTSRQDKANSEQNLFNTGDYYDQQVENEVEAKQKEHHRKEAIKDVLHSWIVMFIKLFLGAAALAGIIYFWHLITPTYFTWNGCPIFRMHFLSIEQLDKLSAFFVTVVLSSTFTSYAKKYIN